jgi:hypothetical protein
MHAEVEMLDIGLHSWTLSAKLPAALSQNDEGLSTLHRAQLYSHLLGRIPGFFSSSEPGILKVIGVSVDAHDQHCQPDSLQRDVILLSGENSAKREFTSINTIS